MINQTVQALFRKACVLTAKQGGQALSRPGGPCVYANDNGQHCAVGHILPDIVKDPDQLDEAYRHIGSLRTLREKVPEVGTFLIEQNNETSTPTCTPHNLLSRLQGIHDRLENCFSRDAYQLSVGNARPFGVPWSKMFWAHCRSLSREYGFDIGPFPKHEVAA